MLNLTLRPAKIGNQITSNGQFHGDQPITAFIIPFSGVMLTPNELCVLLDEPLAYQALFLEKAGEVTQPLFKKKLKPWGLAGEFAFGTVKFIQLQTKDEITFTACTLKSLKIKPAAGGLTELSGSVHTVPTLDARAASFLGQVNHDIEVEISAKPAAEQQDLPLENREPEAEAEAA